MDISMEKVNYVRVKLSEDGIRTFQYFVYRSCRFYGDTALYQMMRNFHFSNLKSDGTYTNTLERIMYIFKDNLDTNIEAWLGSVEEQEIQKGRK